MNWNLIGHQWAADLLQKHIQGKRLRHAYLLTGPTGLGKTTLGLRTAQALFCQHGTQNERPCLTCRTCRQIEKMEHPDLYPIQSQENSNVIKIDQIRELQHSLSLSPYEASHQIAIIENVQLATISAQNALLKTLEEPPPQVIMILTAESREELLETIVSRCESIQLRPVPLDTIQQSLISRYSAPENQARLVAHLSNGRPGTAIRYLKNPASLDQRNHWIEVHQRLLSASMADRFKFAKEHKNDSVHFQEITASWISVWRDVLLSAAGADVPLTNLTYKREIQQVAARVDIPTAHNTLAELERTHYLLGLYANTRLTIENLMLRLPRLSASLLEN